LQLEEFVKQNRNADVAALALRMRQFPELDAAFALQQIEGWQKASQKLPELAAIEGWRWPKRLAFEQCSSETTARYKQSVLASGGILLDLTGGLGVDTYYLSALFDEAHYVERQPELCELAKHNFALTRRNITVHNTTAEDFLANWTNELNKPDKTNITIFLDPARRDTHGGKVFRLADCEPNILKLLTIFRTCAKRILLKLSPMLDITEAVRELGGAAEIHVVAVRNEVKELLVLLEEERNSLDPLITCVNLETDDPEFSFRRSEENHIGPISPNSLISPISPICPIGPICLVEPNAAILKAGAFKLFAQRFGLKKLSENTQLYARESQGSSEPVRKIVPNSSIPGRVFNVHPASKEELKELTQANIICRNFPLSPEALKKKLKLKDGGETYLIAARIGTKPTIFLGSRQFLHI